LAAVVTWEPDQVVVWPGAALDAAGSAAGRPAVAPSWRAELGRHPIRDPNALERWRPGEAVGPTQYYVAEALNRAVKGHVSPRLPIFAPEGSFGIFHEPCCLLGAIYACLLIVFAGHRDAAAADFAAWRTCAAEGCGERFPAAGNRRYCGRPACGRWAKNRRQQRWRATATTPITTPKPADGGG
jgi:hypothetical protein